MEPVENPSVQTTPALPEELPAEQPPPAQPAPKKRTILKIIFAAIGVLILLVVVSVVVILYQLQSKGLTVDKIVPKAIPTSTVTTTNSTTSNNYHNNAYKFSMPYPKDLKINEKPYGFGVTSVEMRSADTPKDYGPDFQMLIFPKAIGEQIGQGFDKYYDLPNNTTQEIKDPAGATVKFTKVKNRTINNQRAFEFSSLSIPQQPDVEAEIGVYIEMGTDTLVISTPEGNRAELETMLTDFKYPL
jgi:hypothetical protein